MKKLIAIPLDRLCGKCEAGRMIARGTKRKTVLGKFDAFVYRECNNPKCRYRAKSLEKIIGVEIDEPEYTGPTLFDDVQCLDGDAV
jgi:hypothetical protein